MRILYSLLLVGVTVVWGWTFVVLQGSIVLYGVLGFLAVRAITAATVSARAMRLNAPQASFSAIICCCPIIFFSVSV